MFSSKIILMKYPFVSVIVPTLNEEKFIENTLKALRNQDYPRYEIIVSDGVSKDKTVEIAKKYADKVIVNKKRGVSVGRNEGARIAKGDVLLFLDADTIVSFNTIEELVKPFKRKKVIGSTCKIFPLSTKNLDHLIMMIYNQFVQTTIFLGWPQIPGICCAYRKDAFQKIGGFNEKMRFLEDYDLSERISKLGKIVFVKDTMVFTSFRRFEKWGRYKAVKSYLLFWIKYNLTKKPIPVSKFRPIRKI
jgi:cellulose synthase/poly-beta-1,6-N-acetylglucosamine synthase-like glycosyltransferase